MKIDLQSIDQTQFMVHLHTVNDEPVWLVQPQHIGCKWNQTNKHFRSSLWDSDGNLVSAGFPKFPNFGESPDTFPVPTDLCNAVITDKLDGSLLIVSKYKGQFILRTRGTVDATKFDNGFELEVFKEKFLPVLDYSCKNVDTWTTSFLFEWLTASVDHSIVLKYENVPDWIFISVINHDDYSLYTQDELNSFALTHGFKRPEQFKFNTVDELVDTITKWKNREGIVLYTNNGQSLHKIKSDDYKKKHAFKSNATIENTIDLYFTFDKPDFNTFKQKIGELYDWECVQMVIGFISNICDAWKEVEKIVAGIDAFVNKELRPLPNRKDQAVKVLSAYSTSSRSSMVFKRLDNKPLDNNDLKRLLYQVMKK